MPIKKIKRKRIRVSPSMRKQLASEFGVTVQTVGNALRLNTEGVTPEMIRKRAMALGGVETVELMVVDC